MLKPVLAFVAVLSAGAIVTPTVSQAADFDSDVRTATVTYADLNLVSLAGRHVLQRRIFAAANSVCDIAAPKSLQLDRVIRTCRDVALDGARPQFEAAVAAALHPSVTVASAATLVIKGQ